MITSSSATGIATFAGFVNIVIKIAAAIIGIKAKKANLNLPSQIYIFL